MRNLSDMIGLIVILSLASQAADGFVISRTRHAEATRREKTMQSLVVDPNSLLDHAPGLHQSLSDQHHHLESLLSTLYTTGIAHGHSNPWFGPKDPLLETIKSIPPKGIVIKEALPPAEDAPEIVKELTSRGIKLFDLSKITPRDTMPGFVGEAPSIPRELVECSTAKGTYCTSSAGGSVSSEYKDLFVYKAEWANNFVNVLDKLPLAAFVYCIVEFRFLRNNVNLRKSEIEQESPTSLWADTLATLTVRAVAMGVVALLTLAIFG